MENFELNELENVEINPVQEGDIINGKIIKIEKDLVYLDIGYKMEGKIDLSEFEREPKVNDSLEVLVLKQDEINGNIILSHKQAEFIKVWNNVNELFNTSPYISGKITEEMDNGYKVDIGIPALLPFSHIKRVNNFEEIKEKQLMFKIIDIKDRTKKVILSRRLYLNEINNKKKKEILETIEEGSVLEGIVKNIKNFGIFVDLCGIDAFIPKSELAWSRNVDPDKIVSINEKVKGSVLSFDKNEEKILLSLKKLQSNPWNTIDKKFQEGMIAKGTIVKIINSGVFVELEPGIEGYISKENLTWAKYIKTPFEVVKKNDIVEFKISSIDKLNKKITLDLKHVLPNPWDEISTKYFVGQKLTVKIKHLVKEGTYVEIEENVEGYIDLRDVSWVKNYRSARDAFKRGDTISAVIIDMDSEKQLIKLSPKQLLINPWQIVEEKMNTRTIVTANIIKIIERGAIVKLEDDLKGFIPISHFDTYPVKEPAVYFKKNDKVKCLIIDIDENKKTAICSPKAYKKSIEKKEMEQYIKTQPTETAKLGDLINISK